MIQHPGLQAVWVSTITDAHASQTVTAIEKGLNVLCKGPLTKEAYTVKLWMMIREIGKLREGVQTLGAG
jgi:hypothetical protein